MKQFYLKILTVLFLSVSLIGCDSQAPINNSATATVQPRKARTIWDRMARNSQINTHIKNPRVQQYIKFYERRNAEDLIKFTEFSAPYIYHIVTSLEAQGMPAELALLPIIESEYRPHALSKMGAAGIWQIAAMTGRLYGLKQDQWYDGRKDIDAATGMALDYLEALYEQFDHDWLLALAAYNCGDGCVSQAIKRNKRQGKPTDFWSLNLPKETKHFVPKFLAVAYMIQNAKSLGLELAPVPNQPYFTKVKLEAAIDLNKAADLAKIDIKEVKKLNPGFRTHKTHPAGPHQILLPVKHAAIFRANFIADQKQQQANKSKTLVKTKVNVKPKVNAKPKTKTKKT